MKNIVIIAAVIWQATSDFSLNSAPQVLVNGAQRALATVQPQRSVVPGIVTVSAGSGVASQPTPEVLIIEQPAPTESPTATPTVVKITPQGLPDAARMPTVTPLPTFEPARFPSAKLQYAVHTVNDKGYEQECVYVYTISKKACLAPGKTFTEESARWLAGMMEAGNVEGEPISFDGPTATPIPPGVCTFANAPYKAHREVVKNSHPIGSVNQASCISQADADAKADQAVKEMLGQ
jgi:hypothetical protein